MSDRLIPESQLTPIVEQMVKKYLTELLGVSFSSHAPQPKYLPTEQAWRELGYKNPRALYNAVQNRLLRVGIEVQDRRPSGGKNATYFFDMEKCLKRLSELPERRR